MPVAGANLLAILHGIAAQGHSRTVAVAVLDLVFGKPALDLCDHFRFGKELIRTPRHVAFRELDRSL
jgi:hypothetical protein|tara:strand:+ start:560 stop:760 length:201 start_codon:yes stop_codon:yes gene_type:complete